MHLQSPTLKSIGSIQHPDNCTECHFHVFNSGGCKSGSSCNFCHEIHPRTNQKKNRRFMKQISARGLLADFTQHGFEYKQPSLLGQRSGPVNLRDVTLSNFSPGSFRQDDDQEQFGGFATQEYYEPRHDSTALDVNGQLHTLHGLHPDATDHEINGGKSAVKSLGSAGHPDNCIECHFHVFNAGGCKSGDSCSYCHELHPRTNRKKNRRFMKQALSRGLVTRGLGANEDVTEDEVQEEEALIPSRNEHISFSRSMEKPFDPDKAQHDKMVDQGKCSRQVTQSTQASSSKSSSGSGSDNIPASSGNAKTATIAVYDCGIRLRYTEHETNCGILHLVTGVRARLSAYLDFPTDQEQALKEEMEFIVEPPLPKGLDLDRKSGLISGIPPKAKAEEGHSVHRVTINVEAICPGGTSLGMITFTSCTLVLRILDFQNLIISPLEAKVEGEEDDQFVLKLQRA